jgi:hypothetical protein
MDKHSQKSRKQAGLLKATSRSLLIGLPAMFAASVALAMPRMATDKQLPQVEPNPDTPNQAPSTPSSTSTSPLNPRPSIFNEPPYNRSEGTSPTDSNAAPTVERTPGNLTPTTPDAQPSPNTSPTMEPAPGSTIQPPLPEQQQAPNMMVTPVDGKINIKLINTTNAVVTYQVVGDTNQRTLTGDSDVTLQNLETPVTVTFVRQDRGLLKVSPQASSSGLLEVTLDETTNLDEGKSTMRIEKGGAVFIN